MLDEDGERLDWGNDDDEQQAPPDSSYAYSPRLSQGEFAGAAEDAEDAVSLGGDDEDERDDADGGEHACDCARVAEEAANENGLAVE